MPASTEVGQYQKNKKDGLQQWADEMGIGMDQLADQILQMAERAVERRSAARLAADQLTARSLASARCALNAKTENVISISPAR